MVTSVSSSMPLSQTSAGMSSGPYTLLVGICLIFLFSFSIVKLFVFVGNMWPIIARVSDSVVLMVSWPSSFSKCSFHIFNLFSGFSFFNFVCLLSFRPVISFKTFHTIFDLFSFVVIYIFIVIGLTVNVHNMEIILIIFLFIQLDLFV